MQLLALQFSIPEDFDYLIGAFIAAITIVALLFAGFFFWLIMRHAAKGRELTHLEKMKALELGRTTGPSSAERYQNKYLHNIFWICFWIGAVVPLSACSAASSVMVKMELQNFAVILSIWICVAVVSVASVICATVLMISGRNRTSNATLSSSENGPTHYP